MRRNERTKQPVAGRSGGFVKLVVLVGLALVALFVGFVAFTLWWSYSDGERAGVLQKFSRRGYVFKTWEGELAMSTVPGVAPVLWEFSCRDEAVANRLESAVGRRVTLHYAQHPWVPVSWFGETEYFVTDLTIQDPQPGF